MFLHTFKYDFRQCVRQKEIIFWLIFFPIILGSFFKVAFSELYDKTVKFNAIPIAVVETEKNAVFDQVIEQVSTGDDALFKVTRTDMKDAENLLKDGKITGIISTGDLSAEFSSSGIEQTIVRSFIRQYKTQEKIITDTAKNSPEKLESVISALSAEVESNTDIPFSDDLDNTVQYFYNLLAMVALFGSMSGIFVAINNQGNLSALGARKCCSPENKLTSIVAGLSAYCVVQTICMIVAVSFLAFVLKIDFGGRLGFVYLSSIIGGFMGVAMGFFVGSFGRLSEGMKMGIILTVSMLSCFLSGLMIGNIKALIAEYAPIVNKINPASVISDSYYCLAIYDDYSRYIQKIILMLIMTVLFTLGGFILTRRRKYASL